MEALRCMGTSPCFRNICKTTFMTSVCFPGRCSSPNYGLHLKKRKENNNNKLFEFFFFFFFGVVVFFSFSFVRVDPQWEERQRYKQQSCPSSLSPRPAPLHPTHAHTTIMYMYPFTLIRDQNIKSCFLNV